MKDSSRMLIGLTGGIASGKSVVAEMLRARGYTVIDADQLSRELTLPGGEAYLDFIKLMGTDDRSKMRDLIAKDPAKKMALETLLHPLIRKKAQAILDALPASTPRVAFYEAALIVETGSHIGLDALWVVEAPKNLRLNRLVKRDGCTEEQAEKMISIQTSDDARRKVATLALVNKDSTQNLESQLDIALNALD